jgi:hypothetical protein
MGAAATAGRPAVGRDSEVAVGELTRAETRRKDTKTQQKRASPSTPTRVAIVCEHLELQYEAAKQLVIRIGGDGVNVGVACLLLAVCLHQGHHRRRGPPAFPGSGVLELVSVLPMTAGCITLAYFARRRLLAASGTTFRA